MLRRESCERWMGKHFHITAENGWEEQSSASFWNPLNISDLLFSEMRLEKAPTLPVLLHAPRHGDELERIALGLAERLLCRQRNRCGDCPDCKAFQHQQHPKFYHMALGGMKSLLGITELLREQLEKSQLGHEATRSCGVLLLTHMERLPPAAHQLLLKALEDPWGSLQFILTTTSYTQLPKTIPSRCQNHHLTLSNDFKVCVEAWAQKSDSNATDEEIRWCLHTHAYAPETIKKKGARSKKFQAEMAWAERALQLSFRETELPRLAQHLLGKQRLETLENLHRYGFILRDLIFISQFQERAKPFLSASGLIQNYIDFYEKNPGISLEQIYCNWLSHHELLVKLERIPHLNRMAPLYAWLYQQL